MRVNRKLPLKIKTTNRDVFLQYVISCNDCLFYAKNVILEKKGDKEKYSKIIHAMDSFYAVVA